jgi:sec-independent protein translocase protein TatB
MLSIPHMIVVFIVVLVVFGPQKLPELARGLGKLMAEFRKASLDFRSAFEEEMRDLERQALLAERKKAAETAAASAAAAPSQPATLATPAGTETPSPESKPEAGATEAPIIAPVAEAVARSAEDPIAVPTEKSTAAAELQESRLDTQQSA